MTIPFLDKDHRAEVGTLIEYHVPHCDTAVAVHDHLLGFRRDTLDTIWPIEARGVW
jgi:hypothetical protein